MKKLILLLLIPIVFLSSDSKKNSKKTDSKKTKVISSDAKRKGIRVVPDEEIGEWRSSRRVAIVVGVSGYPLESGLSSLSFGASDSKKMALSLEQAGGFDRVVLLNDDTGRENPSLLPKRENILEQYENLLSEEPHLVLFYFSGHGFQNSGRNAITAIDTVIARGASKASETEGAKKNAETQEIAKNIIYIDDLITKAQEKKISQTLFFLDACREKLREGAKAGAGEQFGKLPAEVENAKGVGVFMGTAPGGYSYETRELDGGVFTHYLIEGLMGGVQDENPGKAEYVTFGALKDYVEKKVKTYSKKKKNREQIPYTAGDYTGNFLITATRPKGKVRSEILSFPVDGKEKPELARVLFDTNDNPVQMQFFEEGEGEKYLLGDNKEGISKIIYKITDKEYSAAQFHIDGKPAGETYFRILEKGWELRKRGERNFERTMYDERGNGILMENYGADEKLKEDDNGIARYVIKYDENCLKARQAYSCITLNETYGVNGKLAVQKDIYVQVEGFARFVTKYDEKGNQILKETYGADGQLKGNRSDGIARYVKKYDENCLKAGKKPDECMTLKETYGADEKLKADDNGIVRYVKKYDEKGNEILQETYGADGQLKADGKGIVRYVKKYDEKGNEILQETYGANGQLNYRHIKKYDETCLKAGKKGDECIALKETYGADEKLKGYYWGIARYVSKYDEKGNEILNETYGEDEKLKGDSSGIARYVNKYDENCLKAGKKSDECITLKETYGADGQLYIRHIKKYDETCLKAGNYSYLCVTLEETYGADGQLYIRHIKKYDETCLKAGNYSYLCVTLEETYGANGQLNYRHIKKYDETCLKAGKKGDECIALKETYGADEKLKGDWRGFARYVSKYDEKGNEILNETYGEDEKLKGDSSGITRYVNKYDERGKLILTETYGADGQLKENYGGIARYVKKYDEKGTTQIEEFFGADGKLKEENGIAKRVTKYDTKGYKISSTSFSASGSVIKTELSPVFHHPSIPDQILQVTTDELFRVNEVKAETSKK